MSFLASAGNLALAVLVVLRRSESALARPLAVLCLDLFVWNYANMAYGATGVVEWHFIDVIASPWTAPLMLHVALVFVGRLRKLAPVLVLAYLVASTASLRASLAFLGEGWAEWPFSAAWSSTFLLTSLPVVLFAVALLGQHAWLAPAGDERRRALSMLAAGLLGSVLGLTDVWNDFIPDLPTLGHLGTFLSTAIIALTTLRLRLLDVVYSPGVIVMAGALGLGGVAAHLTAIELWSARRAMQILALGLLAAAGLITLRPELQAARARSVRARQMALLGRFAAQMSHDLRNPLAALKGSVQYLRVQFATPESPPELERYLSVMGDQIERIQRAIERYQRIARVEAEPDAVDLNALVSRVATLQPFAAGGVSIEVALDQSLAPLLLDAELFTPALENVIQNAIEATPAGGSIRVSTAGSNQRVCVIVDDNGGGMDPRQAERALDEFFTTKSSGTGLGLTFAKRVAEAHGGSLRISTRLHAGTRVVFDLPARRPASSRRRDSLYEDRASVREPGRWSEP